MKRIIYSFYIDIPKEELDIFDKDLPIIKNQKAKPINYVTKDELKKHSPTEGANKNVSRHSCTSASSTGSERKRRTSRRHRIRSARSLWKAFGKRSMPEPTLVIPPRRSLLRLQLARLPYWRLRLSRPFPQHGSQLFHRVCLF